MNVKFQVENTWKKEQALGKHSALKHEQMVLFALLLRTMIFVKAYGIPRNDLMQYSNLLKVL